MRKNDCDAKKKKLHAIHGKRAEYLKKGYLINDLRVFVKLVFQISNRILDVREEENIGRGRYVA